MSNLGPRHCNSAPLPAIVERSRGTNVEVVGGVKPCGLQLESLVLRPEISAMLQIFRKIDAQKEGKCTGLSKLTLKHRLLRRPGIQVVGVLLGR